VLGLHNEDDFDPDTEADDPRPWVHSRFRDTQNTLWLRLDVPQLLSNSIFLDVGVT
jgi:hypothetical protein